MATGAGKTFTTITAVYCLLTDAKMNRMLFLVDTEGLGKQAEIYHETTLKMKTPLSAKVFNSASSESLEMVVQYRSDLSFHHPCEVVISKIAKDNMADGTLCGARNYEKKDGIKRLKFEKINN